MKKVLWIAGIISVIACLLFLLLGAWNLFGYYHVLDGSAALFDRLQRRMILCFAAGVVLGGIGLVCMLLRRKM